MVFAGACSAQDPERLVSEATHTGSTTSPIIAGKTDPVDTFVVGIQIGVLATCTGVMIAPSLVLTARHCVSIITEKFDCSETGIDKPKVRSNVDVASLKVSTALDLKEDPVWRAEAVYYVNDAKCAEGEPADPACRLCGYDLALIELKPNADGFPKSWVAPSFVPPKRTSFWAIGYGCQSPVDMGCDKSGIRMRLDDAPVIGVNPQDFFLSARVCVGDSGGPLYDPATKTVLGILSRTNVASGTREACTQGIYTRSDIHIDWMRKYGALAASAGKYAAPEWVTATTPDAGVPEAGVMKQPIGSPCKSPDDCLSGICVQDGPRQLCSEGCNEKPCPTGFKCLQEAYCWPVDASKPDAGPVGTPDASPPTERPPPTATPPAEVKYRTSGGCAVGEGATERAASAGWLAIAFAGLLAARRRRPRSTKCRSAKVSPLVRSIAPKTRAALLSRWGLRLRLCPQPPPP